MPRTTAKGGPPDGRSFEKNLKRLEQIVEILEEGKVALDEAVHLYEEGIQISKMCMERLSKAEMTLKRLSKNLDGNFELFSENVEEP